MSYHLQAPPLATRTEATVEEIDAHDVRLASLCTGQ
jgi:hypothetical protein